MPPVLQRAVLWQNLARPGTEYCRLLRHDEGWRLEGTVVQAENGRPLLVRYQIACNAAWETRAVEITATLGMEPRRLELHVDDQRRWWSGATERSEFRGCIDVDLGITPATNTLPIRRLALPVAAAAPVIAAWIRFPALELALLAQRYTRLATDRYRYESDNGFVAELEVDDLGLVRLYPDGWQCLAATARDLSV